MFHADITLVLALIALAAGAFLVLFSKVHKEVPTITCKIIGFIIVILSLVIILFSGYKMTRSCTIHRAMMQKNQQMHQYMMQKMPQGSHYIMMTGPKMQPSK